MSDQPPGFDPSVPPTPQQPPTPPTPPTPAAAPGWGTPAPGSMPPPGYAPQPGYGAPGGIPGQPTAPQQQWGVAPAGYVQQPAAGGGLATGALVCGIIGAVLAIIPCTFFIGGPLALVGLVLGVIAVRKPETEAARAKGRATAGLILGAVGVLAAIGWTVSVLMIADDVNDSTVEFDRTAREIQRDIEREIERSVTTRDR